MKFTKEFLQDIVWDNNNDVDVVYTTLIDTSRWSLHYEQVFEYQDKYYITYYSVGATESQDESPYEYDTDEIECTEVIPVEKTITVYEVAK